MEAIETSVLSRARQIADTFDLKDENIRRCSIGFVRELRLGLQQENPSMCQIPTYVTQVANGSEKGLSLGVDLGGTNLRVCSVQLHGDTTSTVVQSQLPVPADLLVAQTAQELFPFIAKRIEDFLETYHQPALKLAEKDPAYPLFCLGLTFPFPVYQTAVNTGILLRWTKGLDIPDAIGQDVCVLLQTEMDRPNLPVMVTALVNDAMGTIMSWAYSLPLSHDRPTIGAIFGTGTNGVHMEDLRAVSKHLDGDFNSSSGRMFMSTEWGSFDNKLSVLPVTRYGVELDVNSINPGNQMFEKRASGMFLGELLRLAVLELYKDGSLKICWNTPNRDLQKSRSRVDKLTQSWSVDSSILSVAQSDTTDTLHYLRKKMSKAFEIPEEMITVEDAQVVKIISFAIGKRAARLAGTAIGSTILQGRLLGAEGLALKGPKKVDVAVDGSVVERYPGFEEYMREALRAIDSIGEEGEAQIVIGHTKDGSSVGAALIALIAARVAPITRHS